MNKNLYKRGYEKSPILIVGDSLPDNIKTREKLKEVLDRRHPIYNSIIIPFKYYINDYLYRNYKNRYRLPVENYEDDIFMYINAIENQNNKWELDLNSENGIQELNKLNQYIFNKDGSNKYKIIICIGDFSYFMISGLFNKDKENQVLKYVKKGRTKFEICDMGKEFIKNIDEYNESINKGILNSCLILPILHNVANLRFECSHEFITNNTNKKYKFYLQYVAEKISEIMITDKGIKEYLSTKNK